MRKIILSSMSFLGSCVPNPDPGQNTKLHLLKQILKNAPRSYDCYIVQPDDVCSRSKQYEDLKLIIIFVFQNAGKGQDIPFQEYIS